MSLIPAHGRDYYSYREVMDAWNKNLDFLIQDMHDPDDGRYANKESYERMENGPAKVAIRYDGLRKQIFVDIVKDQPTPEYVEETCTRILADTEAKPFLKVGDKVRPCVGLFFRAICTVKDVSYPFPRKEGVLNHLTASVHYPTPGKTIAYISEKLWKDNSDGRFDLWTGTPDEEAKIYEDETSKASN